MCGGRSFYVKFDWFRDRCNMMDPGSWILDLKQTSMFRDLPEDAELVAMKIDFPSNECELIMKSKSGSLPLPGHGR